MWSGPVRTDPARMSGASCAGARGAATPAGHTCGCRAASRVRGALRELHGERRAGTAVQCQMLTRSHDMQIGQLSVFTVAGTAVRSSEAARAV